MRRAAARLLVVSLLVAPGSLAAQAGWGLEARGGRLQSGPGAVASSGMGLGLLHTGADRQLFLGAGYPLGGTDAVWVGASGWARPGWTSGRLFLGVDVTGSGVLLRDRVDPERPHFGLLRPVLGPGPTEPVTATATAASVQALPVLVVGGSRLSLEVANGVAYQVTAMEESREDRAVLVTDAAIAASPTAGFTFEPRFRRYEAPEGVHLRAGVTAGLVHGPVRLRASVGHWIGQDTIGTPWSAGASLDLSARTSVSLDARRATFDPLYRAPEQTAWSVAVSLRLGAVAPPVAPVPAVYADGRATIRLPASAARGHPHIAGDFNEWRPVAMRADGDAWVLELELEPGVYNYSFVTATGEWYVPESVPGRREDGMGGHVAVLVVGE